MNTFIQLQRFFPMPDYDLSESKVKVTISGKILDIEYARVLAKNKNLTLDEIMMLDKVQKKYQLNDFEEKTLKAKKLIEGRKPNYFVSASIAKTTGKMDQYIKNKSFDDKYFKDMILEYIKKNGQITKSEIDSLILDKLPAILDEKQRKNKIRNLIYSLSKREKCIENKGSIRYPIWIFVTSN